MIWDFLTDRMLEHPSATISGGGETLCFAELADQAAWLSHSLPKETIGLDCSSELNTARSLLACFAAGATAVPLSPRYGEEHCRKIVESVGLTWFLTDRDGELRLERREGGAPDRETADRDALSDVELIMCTSGTTGRPKGAMITGRGLEANLRDIESYFRIGPPDRILISRPLYHCAVLTGEFLISLIRGVDVVFYDGAFNPARVLESVRSEKITVLCGTPTLFYHLSLLASRHPRPLGLRTAAISGECLTPAVAAGIRAMLPDAAVYNVYGLTEASPRVCWLPPERFDEKPDCVGLPLPSLRLRVVDEKGNELPAGEAGELLVRGPSLMKGYYRQPEQTARVLRDGWLHTGDVAVMDGEGMVSIRARRDGLIIRAGMNIYPQEIENALTLDDQVKEALAYGVPDGRGSQRIAVKAVMADPAATRSDFLAVCRRRLSPYQIPDTVEFVERLERNASGKLLRPRTAPDAAKSEEGRTS